MTGLILCYLVSKYGRVRPFSPYYIKPHEKSSTRSAKITILVPLIVHPETAVQLPVASHETEEGVAVPPYPVAQTTDEEPPYVVAVILVNVYPVFDRLPQSNMQMMTRRITLSFKIRGRVRAKMCSYMHTYIFTRHQECMVKRIKIIMK